jgi:hypothetical protein
MDYKTVCYHHVLPCGDYNIPGFLENIRPLTSCRPDFYTVSLTFKNK